MHIIYLYKCLKFLYTHKNLISGLAIWSQVCGLGGRGMGVEGRLDSLQPYPPSLRFKREFSGQ